MLVGLRKTSLTSEDGVLLASVSTVGILAALLSTGGLAAPRMSALFRAICTGENGASNLGHAPILPMV